MEGGAMRGMYTCGVTDVFLEHGIEFDGACGVSAGAVFGINFKSKQIGRGIRTNKEYCNDPRYVSVNSLIKTGDIYDVEFCYHTIPEELDPFDYDTFEKNPMKFYSVATDVDTGKPVYKQIKTCKGDDILYLKASASLPALSKYVEIDGMRLSDGGTADSIPLRFMESKGYNKNVIILTQPKGFIKKPDKLMDVIKVAIRKDKALINALENRHIMYNEEIVDLETKEAEGKVFVIRPSVPLEIGRVEKDPDELERVYQIGRKDGEAAIEDLKKFLKVRNESKVSALFKRIIKR